jgi:uncharacterized protein
MKMSLRDGYQPGVPCWVDTWRANPVEAVGFYTELFGWDAQDTMPPGSPRSYYMCRLRGRDVAAVGSPVPEGAPAETAWGTYVWVESADDTAARVMSAGGRVVVEPFDSLDGGRMAIVTDPAGALLGVWQTGAHKGAQVVNAPGAWAMSMLNTHDAERAKKFYRDVFGWETDTFDMGDGEITMWRVPGYVGGEPGQPVSREVVGVMAPAAGADVAPHWSVNFWIDDADAAAETTRRLGGKVVTPPHDMPGFREAELADPQGAVFTVSQLKPGG